MVSSPVYPSPASSTVIPVIPPLLSTEDIEALAFSPSHWTHIIVTASLVSYPEPALLIEIESIPVLIM